MEATHGGYSDILQILLDKKANVNAKSEAGDTPLLVLVFRKRICSHCGSFSLLQRRGTRLVFQFCFDVGPMLTSGGYTACEKLRVTPFPSDALLDTALHLSVREGWLDATKVLVEQGFCDTLALDSYNRTPLAIAIQATLHPSIPSQTYFFLFVLLARGQISLAKLT